MKYFLNKKQSSKKGFTLLEILLVVAIIAILAGVVIIAINPGKQLADSRNAQRKVDVNTILNAIYQYSLDNGGNLPAGLTTTETEICRTGVATTTCSTSSLVQISEITNSEKYLVSIPVDPSSSSANSTNYSVLKTASGRVKVAAPLAEGASISVTR